MGWMDKGYESLFNHNDLTLKRNGCLVLRDTVEMSVGAQEI
jgi:hypothetical protein